MNSLLYSVAHDELSGVTVLKLFHPPIIVTPSFLLVHFQPVCLFSSPPPATGLASTRHVWVCPLTHLPGKELQNTHTQLPLPHFLPQGKVCFCLHHNCNFFILFFWTFVNDFILIHALTLRDYCALNHIWIFTAWLLKGMWSMNVYAYRRNAQAFHTPNQSCIRIYNGVFEFWCEKRVTVVRKGMGQDQGL